MTLSLDELARALIVRDTDVMRLDLGDRWAKRLPAMPTARIYAATQGGGFLQLGEQRLTMEPGELLFLPRGEAHSVRDRPTTPFGCSEAFCNAMRATGPHGLRTEASPETRFVIVDLHLDARGAPWLALLPSLVRIDGATPGLGRWLGETLRLFAEVPDLSPSLRNGLVETFCHVLFAHALRAVTSSFTAGEVLRDEPIAATLVQVRASPEQPWELASLARRAGLSRSAFAARSTAMLGEPLGSYVRRLRLRRASMLLESTALPVKVIASRVGYESEAAFARAFARERGASPSAHRQARSAPAPLTGAAPSHRR